MSREIGSFVFFGTLATGDNYKALCLFSVSGGNVLTLDIVGDIHKGNKAFDGTLDLFTSTVVFIGFPSRLQENNYPKYTAAYFEIWSLTEMLEGSIPA